MLYVVLFLQRFASDGLRTLLCGIKDLTEDEFQTWKAAHHEAAIALTDREDKLDFVYNEIEKNLQLVGATAIEDKLQVSQLILVNNIGRGKNMRFTHLPHEKQPKLRNITDLIFRMVFHKQFKTY